MEINTLFLILSSGFAGAIAGGVVSLIAQHLNRKWGKEDQLYTLKTNLYSEIISFGSHFVGKDIFKQLNNSIARALLICDEDLKKALVYYIVDVETLNRKINNTPAEQKRRILSNTDLSKNTKLHKEMMKEMRTELEL